MSDELRVKSEKRRYHAEQSEASIFCLNMIKGLSGLENNPKYLHLRLTSIKWSMACHRGCLQLPNISKKSEQDYRIERWAGLA